MDLFLFCHYIYYKFLYQLSWLVQLNNNDLHKTIILVLDNLLWAGAPLLLHVSAHQELYRRRRDLLLDQPGRVLVWERLENFTVWQPDVSRFQRKRRLSLAAKGTSWKPSQLRHSHQSQLELLGWRLWPQHHAGRVEGAALDSEPARPSPRSDFEPQHQEPQSIDHRAVSQARQSGR